MVLYRVCVCVQGLGLYAARDIEKCTMVIEYIGTIIRSEVANRKERLYEAQVTLAPSLQTYVAHRHLGLGSDHVRCVGFALQNRGVYMFRIDNDYVIDATITGGPARYGVTHPCHSQTLTFKGSASESG